MALPFANPSRSRAVGVCGLALLLTIIVVLAVALPLRNARQGSNVQASSIPSPPSPPPPSAVSAAVGSSEEPAGGEPEENVPEMEEAGPAEVTLSPQNPMPPLFEQLPEASESAPEASEAAPEELMKTSQPTVSPAAPGSQPSSFPSISASPASPISAPPTSAASTPPSQVDDGGLVAAGAEDETHTLTFDHVAHAVPGRAYVAVDLDGDGLEEIMLDASRSHTHYFEPGPPPKLGVIVSWVWFKGDSNEVLSEASTPFLIFPIGRSELRLRVKDSAGNTHEEKTTVTINTSTRPGTYCYFYDEAGEGGLSFTIEDNVVNGLKPILGVELSGIDFRDASDFPDEVASDAFQARCVFSVKSAEGGSRRLSIMHNGPVRVLAEIPNGHVTIMESTASYKQTTTAVYTFPTGLQAVQILYLRRAAEPALLRLLDAPEPILHNLATQLPLIYSLYPPNSTLAGGGSLKVVGTGLWNDANIYFGPKIVLPRDDERSTPEELFVTVPSTVEGGEVEVTVGNRMGGSNALKFLYDDDGLIPIRFEETKLMKNGKAFKLKLITNLQYGPDHRLYLASLDSFVYSLEVSKSLLVSDICQSDSLGDGRTVIGLAFNYAEPQHVLYVSSSIFFWQAGGLEGDFPWANGQISKIAKDYGGSCLGIVGDPIITGLPVSNHDHGVNSLLFDDDGLLHFNVGAATNAGVPAQSIGGIDESPLSAASLIADVAAPGFDGVIVYDSPDPAVAKQIGGDVKVFSPGWRNSFDFVLHSNGFMYGTENGANAEFGNRSTSCTESALISPYHTDDKLAKLIRGKYGGHANRNRGRTDPIQCVWRNPFEEATNNYNPPLATLESSTDGILEYTADLFGGQLKGNLLASKYSTNDPNNDGRVYRIRLDENGEREGPVESLWEASGLSIEMTPWGDIMMNKLYGEQIMVLKARQLQRETGQLISVTPFRGPVGGGNEVLVTVTGSGKNAVALFAGRACTNVREAKEDSFKCSAPSGEPGRSVQVSIRLSDGTVRNSSGGFDYRYMNI